MNAIVDHSLRERGQHHKAAKGSVPAVVRATGFEFRPVNGSIFGTRRRKS
jgi:hypothetical protein